MINYAIYHYLPGANHSMCICTCGYEEKIKTNISIKKCPKCNARVSTTFQTLQFGSQTYESIFILVKELQGNYNFTIDIGTISGAIKTKFAKKIIAFDEPKLQQQHWRIIFNGSLPKEEMLKIINVKTNEINNIEDIMNAINNLDSPTLIADSTRLKNSSAINLDYFYEHHNMFYIKNAIFSMYNKIKEKIPYCEKHELLIKAGIDPYELNGVLDMEKTTPHEQLKLSPYMFKCLKEHGEHYHRSLQQVEAYFTNQAQNYINTFAKLTDGLSSTFIIRIAGLVNEANLSIKKLYKFLYIDAPMKQGLYEPSQTLTLIYDSYNLAKKLELPFDKNPKALQRYHDILTKEYNLIKDEIKDKDFAKTVVDYKHLEYIEKINENSDTQQNKYGIILPKDAQDLIREGKLMRHCVASYVDRVISKQTIILFLRRAQDLETPYVTIEVNPDDMQICQVKAKANAKLDDQKAIDFLDKWCSKKNIKWNGAW